MLVQEVAPGKYALTKSPALFGKKTEDQTTNAFAVASYAYGPVDKNGESADTPAGGYTGFVRRTDTPPAPGLPPYDILPPHSANKLEHMETVVSASGMVAVVYRDAETNEIILGFKGSASPAGLNGKDSGVMAQAVFDWDTNLNSAKEVPPQYRESAEMLADVMRRYPKVPISVADHSKGGGQVQYAIMANRQEIEQRKENVKGVGINPAMPVGAIRDLQAKGLLPKEHPEKDEFAKRHVSLYAVRTESGHKEILSTINDNVLGEFYGGAYIGETNILFTKNMTRESLANTGSAISGFLPRPAGLAVKGVSVAVTASNDLDNHGMSVARAAYDGERTLPNGFYAKANSGGDIDISWSNENDSTKIALAGWRQKRDAADPINSNHQVSPRNSAGV